jgi:hypothetical protein
MNNRLAENHISSSQLMNETKIINRLGPKYFTTCFFYQLPVGSKWILIDVSEIAKPAPRPDKEVFIKSAAVTRRSVTPKKNIK